jgi:hypothetical protein
MPSQLCWLALSIYPFNTDGSFTHVACSHSFIHSDYLPAQPQWFALLVCSSFRVTRLRLCPVLISGSFTSHCRLLLVDSFCSHAPSLHMTRFWLVPVHNLWLTPFFLPVPLLWFTLLLCLLTSNGSLAVYACSVDVVHSADMSALRLWLTQPPCPLSVVGSFTCSACSFPMTHSHSLPARFL